MAKVESQDCFAGEVSELALDFLVAVRDTVHRAG